MSWIKCSQEAVFKFVVVNVRITARNIHVLVIYLLLKNLISETSNH